MGQLGTGTWNSSTTPVAVVGFGRAGPVTTISSAPAGMVADATPTFAFTADAPATFECRIDIAPFAPCTSPFTSAALTDGVHTFAVRARDAAGNPGPTLVRLFTVQAPAATPAPPVAPKPAVRPVISSATLIPARPVAGSRLTVSFRVRRSDTGAPLRDGRMICDPSLDGRVITHSESFAAGIAKLSFLVPGRAKGRRIRITLTIRTGDRAATRTQTIRIG